MARPWLVTIAFAACMAIVLAVLLWISATVLRLDAAEASARRQAELEENVRLALWRMDTAVAPLLAQESARPRLAYRRPGAFSGRLAAGSAIGQAEYIVIHFELGPSGQLTSPQVAPDSQQRLAELANVLDQPTVLARLPKENAQSQSALAMAQPPAGNDSPEARRQQVRNAQEFQARSQLVAGNNPIQSPALMAEAGGAVMTPLWLDGRLLLARRVSSNGQTYVQGCWLDWPALDRWLSSSVRDLLPNPRLLPATQSSGPGPDRLMAALPIRLEPGLVPADSPQRLSALRLSLLVAWGCVLLAGAAVAVLLVGVVSLSERRAAFVSAVTHELRTPLTTFRMYAEMLGGGMVPDEAQRQQYLATLGAEAERLSHLVENVLLYARLERGGRPIQAESLSVGDLLSGMEGRLRERARQAGLELVVQADANMLARRVRTDASAVEQVLFNLVDNACKYAAGAIDRRLNLDVAAGRRSVEIRVRDHGPGIAPAQARRLFRPFSKSAADAAETAPGVGLGLALSRRLARQLGGDLRYEPPPQGSCFVLSLPA
ncbi:MAG: HAMP domain-containing sensor histidine kinase [Pirellulales bacterium]